RIGLNPTTGEKIIIPAKIVPKFSFSKGLKEYIFKKIKLV
ncbi:MAG: HU family DNA-binding protein, partial [Ureaplasma sp.]|nr:HU family DNA-binding protein [Ureaplasma sp.]